MTKKKNAKEDFPDNHLHHIFDFLMFYLIFFSPQVK